MWSECRRFAAEFFRELPDVIENVDLRAGANELAETYGSIAELLGKASNRKLDKEEQVRLLQAARDTERRAEEKVAGLQAVL